MTSLSTRRAALLILLLAFALRIYRLDAQSLWYDEGLSIYLASLPLGDTIAQSAATDHPPLHALILNLWMRLAGSSEFSVRFVSVVFGTLAVALTYALGRRAGGGRVGATQHFELKRVLDLQSGASVTAGLLCIAPMAVWYAQEARGYSLLITFTLIAILAFWELVSGNWRRRIWLTYVLACAAALYTHYFAAFPLVAMNLVFIYSVFHIPFGESGGQRDTEYAIRNTRYVLRNWLLAQLAIVALFLPWLPNAVAQAASNATYFPGHVTWDTVVLETWRAFAGGDFPHLSQPAQPPPTGALWLALILLGAIGPLIHHRRSFHTLTLTLTLIVSFLLMSILAWDKPKFAPRYLLPSLPAFVTLAALGVNALLRFRSRLLAIVALLPMLLIPAVDLIVTAQIYFDPPVARPDARSVAAYIDAHDEPGDAIVLVAGHQWPVFAYYYNDLPDVIPLPPDLLPAAQSPLDARVVSQLVEIAETHPRAWLVLWQQDVADPMSVVLNELQSHAKRLEVGQNFHEMSLLLFDLREARFAPGPQYPLDATFADPIRLAGYDLDSNKVVAGQGLKFALYFEAKGSIARNYQVLTHLIGPDGAVAVQADRIAGADSYPTSLWSPGALIRNTFDMRLPTDLPAGAYRLVIGLYDAAGRLAVSGGDTLELATIEVRH